MDVIEPCSDGLPGFSWLFPVSLGLRTQCWAWGARETICVISRFLEASPWRCSVSRTVCRKGANFHKPHTDGFFSIETHPAEWDAVKHSVCFCAFQAVFPFPYNLPRTMKLLNLCLIMTWSLCQRAGAWTCHVLWKQQWGCFREVREVCGFASGNITCLSYLGLETTKNTKDLSCLMESVFGKPALSSCLELTSSCFSHVMPLGCGLTSREFLFINYFKVKAKRGFASSHT